VILRDPQTNVYVLGATRPLEGFDDLLLLKYDPDGCLLWSATYDSPDHNADEPAQMLVDGVGNIYVAAYSYSSNGVPYTLTLKYDNQGALKWAARYEALEHCSRGSKIAFDTSGNLKVSFLPCSTAAVAVVTYDLDGRQLGVDFYASPWAIEPHGWVVDQD